MAAEVQAQTELGHQLEQARIDVVNQLTFLQLVFAVAAGVVVGGVLAVIGLGILGAL